MPFVIACHHCQRQIGVPEAAVGKAVRCPHCKGVVRVEAPPADLAVAISAAPLPPAPPPPEPEEDFVVLDEPAPKPGRKQTPKPIHAGSGKKRGLVLLVGLGVAGIAFAIAAAVAFVLARGLVSALLGGGAIADTDWKEFSPPDGKLRVLMPGSPRHDTQKAGNKTLDQFTVDRGRVSFVVLFGTLTDGEINAKPWHERFQAAGQGMLKAVPGAKIRSQKHLKLDGNSGMEFVIDSPGKGTAVAHIYGVHTTGRNQYLTLIAAGPDFGPDAPPVTKFFDSLRLEKETPAVIAGQLPAATRAQKLELIADLKKHGAAASEAVPALAEVVKDTPFVQACTAAAELLGDIGPAAAAAVPTLTAVLEAQQPRKGASGDVFIRVAVAGALARIDPKDARAGAALRDITKDRNEAVVIAARAYLVQLDPVANAADLDELIQSWKTNRAGERRNAGNALVRLGPLAAKAVPVLAEGLRSQDVAVRNSALEVLRDLGSTARPALPALRALDVAGTEEFIRHDIRDACKAIESAP